MKNKIFKLLSIVLAFAMIVIVKQTGVSAATATIYLTMFKAK